MRVRSDGCGSELIDQRIPVGFSHDGLRRLRRGNRFLPAEQRELILDRATPAAWRRSFLIPLHLAFPLRRVHHCSLDPREGQWRAFPQLHCLRRASSAWLARPRRRRLLFSCFEQIVARLVEHRRLISVVRLIAKARLQRVPHQHWAGKWIRISCSRSDASVPRSNIVPFSGVHDWHELPEIQRASHWPCPCGQ